MVMSEKLRYAIGIVCLIGVVFLWVGSSFLINYAFTGANYFQPFALTYFGTTMFVTYTIPIGLGALYRKITSKSSAADADAKPAAAAEGETVDPKMVPLTTKETAMVAFQFCWLWFIANYTSNVGLGLTTVASSTILASMSGPFTLILATLVGADTFTVSKFLAVALSIGGVTCVALDDNGSTTEAANPILGDVLALIGAVFYAIYIVFLKVKIGHESRLRTSLFFAFVGAFNAVFLLPFMGLAHITGVETFRWPEKEVWGVLIINAMFGTVLSDYLWITAMLMTGPIVVTVGLSLTTPLSMIGDLILKGITYSPLYVTGAVLIVIGFIGANLEFKQLDAKFNAFVARFRKSSPPAKDAASA
ncbi:hypothetical protein H9P43_008146 [Blastocladiella emersonii ATCC 22665]|nr:hypothetical protein H9P43_008146 [Blastocladiella emersonii ATCC 22665]